MHIYVDNITYIIQYYICIILHCHTLPLKRNHRNQITQNKWNSKRHKTMEFQIHPNPIECLPPKKKTDLKFLGNNPPSTPLHPESPFLNHFNAKNVSFLSKELGGLGAAKRGKGRKHTNPTAPTTPRGPNSRSKGRNLGLKIRIFSGPLKTWL